ncbi:hypothetical protein D3C85_938020 [compost metagenome]
MRVVHIRGTQLDQLDATGNGLLHATQQLRIFQAFWSNQVFAWQARRHHDRLVGFGKVIVRQFPGRDPGQRLAFGTVGLAGKACDLPDIQQHLLVRVVMLDLDQRASCRDDNAQFLVQLSGQGWLDGLALLDLATRKFPQAALVLGIGTLGNEDPAVAATDDSGGHMNAFHAAHSFRPSRCQAWNAGHW